MTNDFGYTGLSMGDYSLFATARTVILREADIQAIEQFCSQYQLPPRSDLSVGQSLNIVAFARFSGAICWKYDEGNFCVRPASDPYAADIAAQGLAL